MDEVILVNEDDVEIGRMEKIEAHERGVLHRAFSIFIFNSGGQMLLQQRAQGKYHSPGLWTNACCSHPKPGEGLEESARRRLKEEMGFSTGLTKAFDFVYHAEFDNGLSEHEFDHVFTGEYEGEINHDQTEVMNYCYKDVGDVKKSLADDPGKYTRWFELAFPRIEQWWQTKYGSR